MSALANPERGNCLIMLNDRKHCRRQVGECFQQPTAVIMIVKSTMCLNDGSIHIPLGITDILSDPPAEEDLKRQLTWLCHLHVQCCMSHVTAVRPHRSFLFLASSDWDD